MYLMRIGAFGAEKPVARIDDHSYVDLSDVVVDYDELFFGTGGLDRIRPVVAERVAAGQVHSFAGERVGAPIARPHQIICVGLNYRDHAAETGQAVPDEPILFTKSPNTIVGPDDDVRIPRGSTKPDWEVELGIVIGKRTSYLDSVDDARAVAERQHEDDGLRPVLRRPLHQPVPRPGTGRSHQHRYPAGCRHGLHPADLAAAG